MKRWIMCSTDSKEVVVICCPGCGVYRMHDQQFKVGDQVTFPPCRKCGIAGVVGELVEQDGRLGVRELV
jgi:hypothetical protein